MFLSNQIVSWFKQCICAYKILQTHSYPAIGLNIRPALRISPADESEVSQSTLRNGLIIRFHHRSNRQKRDKHGPFHRPPTSDNARSARSQHQQWHLSNGRIGEAQAPTTQFGLSAMCLAEDEMRAQSCARQMREVSSLPSFLEHLQVRLPLGGIWLGAGWLTPSGMSSLDRVVVCLKRVLTTILT
jgi:hypothetical protein